jgi:hypothetical protein
VAEQRIDGRGGVLARVHVANLQARDSRAKAQTVEEFYLSKSWF